MTSPRYIPLRMHTEFSIEDGMIRIKDAVKHASGLGFAALGISDLMNLFGMVKFYKACRGAGIKPIIGVDVWVQDDQTDDGDNKPYRLLLIARNQPGFKRLCELITQAYVDDDRDKMDFRLRYSWLESGDNSGLICLSGAHLGSVGQYLLSGRPEQAKQAASALSELFPNRFYLELQRLPEKPEWENAVVGSLNLAQELDLPIVATHPAQFLNKDDFQAHEARVCIASGSVRILAMDGSGMRWVSHVNISEELKEDASYFQRLYQQSPHANPSNEAKSDELNYRIVEVDSNEEKVFPIQYQQTVHGWLTLFPAVGTAICQQEEWLINNACVQLAMKLEIEA